MNTHPQAAAIAAAVAGRDSARLAAAVTDTVRLRALLPGGPIEEHGRDAVVARFGGWFADMDTVDLVESAGETVADRLLIHYRLDLAQRGTRWACTQTSICKINDGRLAYPLSVARFWALNQACCQEAMAQASSIYWISGGGNLGSGPTSLAIGDLASGFGSALALVALDRA